MASVSGVESVIASYYLRLIDADLCICRSFFPGGLKGQYHVSTAGSGRIRCETAGYIAGQPEAVFGHQDASFGV